MSERRLSPDQIMDELRRLRARDAADLDRLALLHEVSVYQEELLAQNDALIRARSALEETRDRFVELYDFAPNGYLTLDDQGVIRQCNLTAAAIFGESTHALEGMPLLGFVETGDRLAYFDFLRQCRSGGQASVEIELTIRGGEGPRSVQLLCRRRMSRASLPEYLTSVIDVTERKQLESERERMAREHAALAGRLISVQDAERTRIARNLHDDIGQELTALRLTLELLANQAPPSTMGEIVARAQHTLEALDRRLHFVAGELRPASLDLGIVAALEQFARQWSGTFGIPVTFQGGGIAPNLVTPDVETHIYRIAQEALNNVSKHAAASKLKIVLERHGDNLELYVHDNGRGFDVEAARRRQEGFGLAGMRERAQLIGGRLELQSSGRGTSVVLRLPISPSAAVPAGRFPAADGE